jgi:hypothetical protein
MFPGYRGLRGIQNRHSEAISPVKNDHNHRSMSDGR